MEKFGYVKKYTPVLCFILYNIINLVSIAFVYLMSAGDSTAEVIITFVLDFLIFISLFTYSIKVFIFQVKFNKNASNYFTLLADGSLQVNGQTIDFENIVSVTYYKTLTTVFGDSQRGEVHNINTPLFNFDRKIYEKRIRNAEQVYDAKAFKSSTGNIIIKFKDSLLVLKRVRDIEYVVSKLQEILKDRIQIEKKENV